LARDTVFAAVMIILNGMVGLCILIGAIKFKKQSFSLQGISSALTVLVAISVLKLIFPIIRQVLRVLFTIRNSSSLWPL